MGTKETIQLTNMYSLKSSGHSRRGDPEDRLLEQGQELQVQIQSSSFTGSSLCFLFRSQTRTMNNHTDQHEQDQFSITFSKDEKWLYEWVNEQVRTLPFTRAGYTKRLYMNDYQRMKCNGGKRKYPATTSAVIY